MVDKNHLFSAFCGMMVITFVACAGGGKSENVAEADSVDVEVDSVVVDEDSLLLLDTQPVPAKADELFDDFFFNFINDVRFQRKRTDYPMKKHKGSIFEHFSTQDFFAAIYENEDDIVLQKDTTLRNVGVEWIYLDSMYVDRFNFRKIDGEWLLISRTEYAMDSSLNADFLMFYDRFVNDTLFQKESLGEGVKFVIEASEGDEEIDSVVTADSWSVFCADKPLFNPILVNIDYGQKIEDDDRRDLLFQGFSNGVSIKFCFEKDDEQWLLKSIDL